MHYNSVKCKTYCSKEAPKGEEPEKRKLIAKMIKPFLHKIIMHAIIYTLNVSDLRFRQRTSLIDSGEQI